MRGLIICLLTLLVGLPSFRAFGGLDETKITVMLNSGYKSSDIEALIRHDGYTGKVDQETLKALRQSGASLELIDLISYHQGYQPPLEAPEIRAMLLNKQPISTIAQELDNRGFEGALTSAQALDLVTYGATPDLIKVLQKFAQNIMSTPDDVFLLIGSNPTINNGVLTFDKAGYGTVSRRMLIRPEWEEAGFFHSGLARVKIGDHYGYIDKTGAVAVPPHFTVARDFSEGRAVVSTSTSDEPAYRFITTDGRLLSNDLWAAADDFSEGLAKVTDGDKYGFIALDGSLAIPTRWTDAGNFRQGLAWVKTSTGTENPTYGFIDKKGVLVISANWEEAKSFSEGLAAVKKNGLWGYIDRKGKVVIENKYHDAKSFSESVAAVKVDYFSLDKWVYINYSGELGVTGTWLVAGDYHKGLAQVSDSNGPLVINKVGSRQIPLGWTIVANQPSADVILVSHELSDDRLEAAYMDLSGRIIWRSE